MPKQDSTVRDEKADAKQARSHSKTKVELVNESFVITELFDQRLNAPHFKSNAIAVLLKATRTDARDNVFMLAPGWLTAWPENHVFQQPPSLQLPLLVSYASQTLPLKHEKSLALTSVGLLGAPDLKEITSAFNPEAKVMFKSSFKAGMGAMFGKGFTDDQLYATAGYKNTQLNVGGYWHDESTKGLRAVVSYDWKINPKNEMRMFVSTESGGGQQRLGAIYKTKIAQVSFRADATFSTATAHHIENINARTEIPFVLNAKSQHALRGAITTFAGISGQLKSQYPDAEIIPVGGLGMKLSLFNSEQQKKVAAR